jgi:hypothetical protein
MPITPEMVRSLQGKPVDVLAPAGTPKYRGLFRVTEAEAGLPTVEAVYRRAGETVSVPVPASLLSSVLLTRADGRYLFWEE